MIVHAEILVVLLLSGILGPVVAQGQPERKPAEASPGGGPAMVSPEPNPDAQAISGLLGHFIKAYNARDAKALGELFTPDAEIEDEDGEVTRGRDAIVARFAGVFGGGQSGTLGMKTDSLPSWEPILPSRRGRRPSRLVLENLPGPIGIA